MKDPRDNLVQTPTLQMGDLGASDSKLSSVILAITGEEVQKSGNNSINQVLLSIYSVLFFTKNSTCIFLFNLQKNPAGRFCSLSPLDQWGNVVLRSLSNFQRR